MALKIRQIIQTKFAQELTACYSAKEGWLDEPSLFCLTNPSKPIINH